MKQEIEKYLEAAKALKEAEVDLNKVVGPKIKACGDSIDDLNELVSLLPPHYRGCRRIYQKMLELDSKGEDS
jgi:hypothetical protein